MLPTPAESGPERAESPGSRTAADSGLMAAPVAGAVDISPRRLAEARIQHRGCFSRPLPLDRTCSAVARRFFRESVAGLGLPADLVHDGITMASELAANTLHADGNVEFRTQSQRPVSGCPEFWLYVRGEGARCELICKVFDSDQGWETGTLPDINARTSEKVSGRGLQVVAGLSAGQWGAHLTRGRLGCWKVPGKAVWFALRVPPGCGLARHHEPAPSPADAVTELEAMLAQRGLGGRLVRADEPAVAMSVLSVSCDLTVWCHGGTASWRRPDGGYDRFPLADLVDVAERVVCAHEELGTPATAPGSG
jgi:hypothetical protein